jgi:hypothetical protein
MLPIPGTHAVLAHPYASGACFAAAAACAVAFVRAHGRVDPRGAGHVTQRGERRPRWTRAMWLYLVGAFALYALGIAL